jgi:hypothetical protein
MCSVIPYSPTKVPSTARTTAYHVIDFYGLICVWFPLKSDLAPPTVPLPPPDYFPLPLEKIESGNMVLRGATKLHINMHLQEVGLLLLLSALISASSLQRTALTSLTLTLSMAPCASHSL